jgi:hypothetical protein
MAIFSPLRFISAKRCVVTLRVSSTKYFDILMNVIKLNFAGVCIGLIETDSKGSTKHFNERKKDG